MQVNSFRFATVLDIKPNSCGFDWKAAVQKVLKLVGASGFIVILKDTKGSFLNDLGVNIFNTR